ncbi:VOC family protein [Notoacmeibacter sp. MSK16QG-6]|uniref:VOC family protein n=1 Tax=Notoacmeibacter sp. MSK16QG-6 TaxID=2957982 RepID=UPI00209F7EA6|nr:VOC family protein [Notoacmeibacter sp. MSK16QG-6]MCP1198430.1 VOC family protein [Notoacmeibacter sp. MSK16QG-6]
MTMTEGLPSRLTMVTLGVTDIARSTAFYEKLGWKKSSASNESVSFFHMAGTKLGLFGRTDLAEDAHVANTETGFSGVALAINFDSEREVDAAFDHAVSVGATPAKRPEKVFWGGYSGYFADPDGHLWELAHNPMAPLDDNGNMRLPE